MGNRELARCFEELADLLEFKGESSFKVSSYRRAARVLEEVTTDVAEMAAEGSLTELPGIGESIAKKIVEYLKTGKITRLEEARKGVPPGVVEMLDIPGLGPKKVALFHKELRIDSVAALEEAAKEHKIAGLKGMGDKTEENILRGIQLRAAAGERMLLDVALESARMVIDELKSVPGLIERIESAGSLRRRCETVGDVDILACGSDPAKIMKAFTEGSFVEHVLAAGETKGSVVAKTGRHVDLRVVEPKQFGAALQYFTGSKAHNIKLRGLARKDGLKINEYGLFKGEKVIASQEEEHIYRALGMEPMPPELREDRGEIEAAVAGNLPALVELEDIKGDFHVHSDYSDGRDSIADLAEAAKKAGYRFIAVTDHSQSLHIANGLTPERLREQMKEIAALNSKLKGIRALTGTEVDIKPDGELDLPDDLLAELDIVIAAIHSGFKQPREKITARLASAMKNPHVDIIAHPTGRLIGRRDEYDADVPDLIRTAAATGTALEINCSPDRLDLNDVYCRMAREHGVRLAIGTDVHSADALGLIELGVSVARRGWLGPGDILNTQAKPKLKGK